MNKKQEYKACMKLHGQCFANKDGLCMILTETWFKKGKECPFYATQDEVDAKRWQARRRLFELGLVDLEKKYRDGR